ncbi:MAG: hypothetical protein EXS31_09090 [Pedosphaera sp.]|nr:hypothetical protein [Pedosphaera sp.]
MNLTFSDSSFRRTASVAAAWLLTFALPGQHVTGADSFKIQHEENAIVVHNQTGTPILRYQLERPTGSTLTVESGCYFHPLTTPSGFVMTDEAPSDHLHHRGVFLAWVEMHGKKDADFWGWGEHAPKTGRKIVNQKISQLRAGKEKAGFRAQNAWMADETILLKESLETKITQSGSANILDLNYHLEARSDIRLAQWAFSGFCVRTRKAGEVEAFGPDGIVKLLNPKHTEPSSDWPSAPWYGYTLRMPDGKTASVAVLDHPSNPPSLWHNHRDIRMLNPCITAPAAVTIKAGKPLVLRYRVVVADEPIKAEMMNRLRAEWSR